MMNKLLLKNLTVTRGPTELTVVLNHSFMYCFPLAAGALFVGNEISINAINGWGHDELLSLWFSDVSLPFIRAFSERIVSDTNPPLFYVVLYWVRCFISADRNIAALLLSVGVSISFS